MIELNFFEKMEKLKSLRDEISTMLLGCSHDVYKKVTIIDSYRLMNKTTNYEEVCLLCGITKEHALERKLRELKALTAVTEEQLKEIK